jgi:phenylacetate-coenzyme A ligase PaaK-like adenylate-forming protein
MIDSDPIERLPLKDLVDVDFRIRHLVNRAYKSEFYHKLWKANKINSNSIKSVQDLRLLPLFDRKELSTAIKDMKSRVGCVQPNSWFAHLRPPDNYEWFPFNEADYLGIVPRLRRMAKTTELKNGDIVLSIVDSAPEISSVLPFLYTTAGTSEYPKLEFITVSLKWYELLDMTWIDFMQKRRPTILFASTENALALAEKTRRDHGIPPIELLPDLRAALLYGEPVENNRSQLEKAYSAELYEIYSPLECMSFSCECRAHAGIHVWLDYMVPEIIVSGEPQLLWDMPEGTVGELVVTNFADCFPLIRYRTGESIMLKGTDVCSCGRTHPRVARLSKNSASYS